MIFCMFFNLKKKKTIQILSTEDSNDMNKISELKWAALSALMCVINDSNEF